jgi:hypothetical protein
LFFEQRYEGPKTLLIYDDSPTPLALCKTLASQDVTVVGMPATKLPVKRNTMMRAAIARDPDAIFFVWDDDDYQGPERVTRQIDALQAHPTAEGCIFCPYLVYDAQARRLHQLGKATLHGLSLRTFGDATLAFRRSLWERIPWDETIDPNACWRWRLEPVDRIVDIPGEKDYVVVRHVENHTLKLWPDRFHPAIWTPDIDVGWPAASIEQLLAARCCT